MSKTQKIFLLSIVVSMLLIGCKVTVGDGDPPILPRLTTLTIESISNTMGTGVVITFSEDLKTPQTIDVSKIRLAGAATGTAAKTAAGTSPVDLLVSNYWIDEDKLHLTLDPSGTAANINAWNNTANVRAIKINEAGVIEGEKSGANLANMEFANTTTSVSSLPLPVELYATGTTIYMEYDEPVTPAATFNATAQYEIKSDANATPTTPVVPTGHAIATSTTISAALTTKFPKLTAAKAPYVVIITVPALTATHKISVRTIAGALKDKEPTPVANSSTTFTGVVE